MIDFYQGLMRGSSALSAGEKEALYSYLSFHEGCQFCHPSHRYCAIGLGIDPGLFELSRARPGDALISDDLRAALEVAFYLTQGGLDPSNGMRRDVIRDAIHVTGLTVFINRIIEGLDAEAPEEVHKRNGEGLATNGYLVVRSDVEKGFRQQNVQPSKKISTSTGTFIGR